MLRTEGDEQSLSQGYLAAGDAYTRRYDEIIKDIPDKVKCVDDSLLYDTDIERSFYHAWDYLSVCLEIGITVNEPKFIFCQDTAVFGGLKLTPTGVCPSDNIVRAIKEFPTPKNLTDARSWFGIVNQIAWAYSNTDIMQPFRELVKSSNMFYWDDKLEKLFQESKDILIQRSIEGIRTFDKSKDTCLQTDWSKEGIGYLLLQKYCECSNSKSPVCCKDGWKLVFAGSRFTKGPELRYSPTEGEALAVAWSLEHARIFTLGCKNLTVSTDHKPLLGILSNRALSEIKNPRLLNLKERTLMYRFNIQYNPGKWHRGPDALSRNPVTGSAIHALFIASDNDAHCIEDPMEAHISSIMQYNSQGSRIASIEESSSLIT